MNLPESYLLSRLDKTTHRIAALETKSEVNHAALKTSMETSMAALRRDIDALKGFQGQLARWAQKGFYLAAIAVLFVVSADPIKNINAITEVLKAVKGLMGALSGVT